MGLDGLLHFDEINLNECYENDNGSLQPGRHFAHSCNSWDIEIAPPALNLVAMCRGNHWFLAILRERVRPI
jgi:CVNH domain.